MVDSKAQWPDSGFSSQSQAWRRMAEKRVSGVEARADEAFVRAENANRGRESSARSLALRVQEIADLQSTQSVAIDRLNELAVVEYLEFVEEIFGVDENWLPRKVQVEISTSTGRLEIEYGGAGNGGDMYFCYQVLNGSTVVVNRSTIQGNPARRVAVTGGASFAPSGARRQIATGLPRNVPLTVSLEIYTKSRFVTVFGGSIMARVAP